MGASAKTMIPTTTRAITRILRASLLKFIALLFLFSLFSLLLLKVDDLISKIALETKTVAGHNLAQTPWHHFPVKHFNESNTIYGKAFHFLKCTHFQCLFGANNRQYNTSPNKLKNSHNFTTNITSTTTCPSFFRWIHRDLEPWAESRIAMGNLMEAQRSAAFRVVIFQGRLYVDFYFSCTQTRAMFTIWGLLQLLKRYPGMVPDVDMMFDCMDRPVFQKSKYRTKKRPETNIQPWEEEFKSIKRGSEAVNWDKKLNHAYWRGNPFVGSRARTDLLHCNDTNKWGAEIYIQNWIEEAKVGYKKSSLADQCKHRYKIYAEGWAWSVSLKYILSCNSLALLISPQFQDFFTRGLIPTQNYWPVKHSDLCRSIKFAVEWGNSNPIQAARIGREGQRLMERLNMDMVYDYMYHLISEYSKLQNFKPMPPKTAYEVCEESVLCYADSISKQFLEKSVCLLHHLCRVIYGEPIMILLRVGFREIERL
ncbi:hypothetical protein Sjap_014100 [Stephania japonica]|uniref:Glycosyl transferase CAP10 domain-containing protein n=1 Tax=Stephania japonica TaxID=461633 RepID=A0AAP0IZ99_9MAGN